MLSLLPGYNIGKPNSSKVNILHLFFVDDLKTFTKNKNEATLQFGLDKCAYIYIERGKRTSLGTKLTINNIEITELESGDTYKCFGQDEDIGFKGELNKQRVMEEYLKRVRKIWNSELYSRNKVLAHNIFAIPVLSPTFRILDWTKQELENLDIETRKILTASGSFHINSDVDRLYCYRKNGGRGLNSIVDTFISRIVSLSLHLKNPRYDNRFLKHVLTHETERLIRVAENLLSNFSVEFQEGIQEAENSTKVVNMAIKRKIKENHLHEWICKTQHGYLERSRKNVPNIDKNNTEIWLKKAPLSSHIEGYIFAIQEEEINTNLLVAKRDGDRNTNCRLCKKEKESIQHVIASCPKLSVSMYLPLRHDKVAKVIYDAIIDRKNQKKGIVEIYSEGNKEIWWDKKIATIPPLKHNKPDILYWNKHDNICFIIDIAVGLDVNITKNIKLKHDNYMQLSSELKRLYPNFSFEIVPIVLGATGLVTSDLRKNIEKLGIVNINDTLAKCQRMALLGTMKIVKSVMRMKNN